jgi:hypothetical protein
MQHRVLLSILGLLAALFAIGCATPAVSAINTASLASSLRAAGVSVEMGDEITQPFFAVKGKIVKLNGNDVQVFEYADANKASADAALVARDGSSIGTGMPNWISAPHFFKKDNLIVLYVGDNKTVLDVLTQVLGVQFAGR